MIPNVAEALWDWTDPIEIRVLKKELVDFEATERLLDSEPFQGNLQPIPPTKLLVKPEGQRMWQWWYLHTTQELFIGDEVVTADGKQYKVMTKSDWPHVKIYELVQEPKDL